jgi:HEAT repeat protein
MRFATVSTPQAFIDDIAHAGFLIEDVWDLVNTRVPYPAAIPVLLSWLDRVDTDLPEDAWERDRFREALVRSLSVRAARGIAAPAMIREFHRDGISGSCRWAAGNALHEVADNNVFEELLEIAEDRSCGPDRQMVVLGLGRFKDPRTVDVLIGLLDDEDVAGHAISALGKLRDPRSRTALEPFVEHPRTWWRNAAKKALARIKE